MNRIVYHVVPIGQAWGVRRARRVRPDSLYWFKKPAVGWAKRLAKAAPLGQVKVHGRNGQIQSEFTYRGDPPTSEG